MGISFDAHAAVHDIPPGTTSLDNYISEYCYLTTQKDGSCSLGGACVTKSHIDLGASEVGKTVGAGPLSNGQGVNLFNRFFGLQNATSLWTARAWVQVGPAGPGQCKVLGGASSADPLVVGQKANGQIGAATFVDLVTTLSGPATANPGANVTFTITVTNKGNATATGVTTQVIRPTAISSTAASFAGVTGCSAQTTQGTNFVSDCPLGSLAAGASKTFTFTTPTANAARSTAHTLSAIAKSVEYDVATDNNTATSRLVFPSTTGVELTTTLSMPATAKKGDTVAFTITVTNWGQTTATNVRSRWSKPFDLTGSSGGTTGTGGCTQIKPSPTFLLDCPLGNLAAGDSKTWTYNLNGANPTTPTNTISTDCSADQPDAIMTNNGASKQIVFSGIPSTTPGVDLETTLSMPATANKGDTVIFTITVANKGATTATNVRARLTRPAGLTGGPASTSSIGGCGAAITPTSVTNDCPFGSLALGQSKTWTYTIATATSTVATNTLTADSRVVDQTDAIPANNSVSKQLVFSGAATTTGVDLETTLSMPSSANKGDNVAFTIAVTNKGATTATNVRARFIRPQGLTGSANSSSITAGCEAILEGTNTVIDCPLGSLAAGGSRTWTYNLNPASPTAATNTLTAVSRADQTDAIPANNSVSKQLVFSGL